MLLHLMMLVNKTNSAALLDLTQLHNISTTTTKREFAHTYYIEPYKFCKKLSIDIVSHLI